MISQSRFAKADLGAGMVVFDLVVFMMRERCGGEVMNE